MKNSIFFVLLLAILAVIGCAGGGKAKKTNLAASDDIEIVPTMQDEIKADSCWVPTFQLIWNDLKNDIAKKDIVFTPQEKIAENLNKESFTESMLSSDYYYKTYGAKTLSLKKKIEDAIWKKFEQKSDILNDFSWSPDEANDGSELFLYSMLYRKMEFLKKFDVLKKGNFKTQNNIAYFGINESTNESVREQVEVLFYNGADDFAIAINTKSGDQVILYKNPTGKNFEEIYKNILINSEKFEGFKNLSEQDELKVPMLDINKKHEYTEIQNKVFETANPKFPMAKIEKALQTVQLTVNENGATVKSEAGMGVKCMMAPIEEEKRCFYVDNTFALFLKEKNRKLPYFAARIDDISKFQGAEK